MAKVPEQPARTALAQQAPGVKCTPIQDALHLAWWADPNGWRVLMRRWDTGSSGGLSIEKFDSR